MSDKPSSFDRLAALSVAKELCAMLEPACERLIVAGSLRRRKSTVHDVEILFIPKVQQEADGLFETKPASLAGRAIDNLLACGVLKKRANAKGVFTWGELNKLSIHVASGIPVDLFATSEENWWVSKVIRTGGLNTNLMLTMGAQKLGRKLHAYGSGFTDHDGSSIICKSEEQVFELAGVPYKEPWQRV